MGKLKEFIDSKEDLKDRVYYITLGVACVCMVVSLIADYFQGFDIRVLMTLLVSFVIMLLLFVLSVRYGIERIGRRLLVYLFNVIIFPELFLYSGGVTCGMVLVFILSYVILGILLDGKSRIIAYIVSILVTEYVIYYSYSNESYINKLGYKESVSDFAVTLVIISLTVIYIIAGILKAYDEEKKRTDELNDKLRELSVKDELSGLYNRRELFRRLDTIYECKLGTKVPSSKQGCYIAMFDIDNFKALNDTYGHQFGDEVLASVARVLRDNAVEADGELAARYGGEEFVSVLRAKDKAHAKERVERIRIEIEKMRWEEEPELVVTVSGGLASCEMYDELKIAMHDVDELLYKAKHEGKNQIQD
ncbi:MAG: diguanylate cyclase [Lachnospiraceae bacterium]|nr:diguanylate cyclase [Lachnospiraceae bacterium]